MNRLSENVKAPRERGQDGKAESTRTKSITKIERVISALMSPAGLNRFEAERIGDHTLNSTMAKIRVRCGARVSQEWETVPTPYCKRGVRVLRYWLMPSDQEAT